MKFSQIKMLFYLLALIICFGAFNANAQSIKSRMKSRLPQIVALKDKGIVGESNKGYLEFVKKQKESKNVVSAENRDRKIVYTAIAKKRNTTPELVGKRRARQIAHNAKTGHWLQSPEGKWYQK